MAIYLPFETPKSEVNIAKKDTKLDLTEPMDDDFSAFEMVLFLMTRSRFSAIIVKPRLGRKFSDTHVRHHTGEIYSIRQNASVNSVTVHRDTLIALKLPHSTGSNAKNRIYSLKI